MRSLLTDWNLRWIAIGAIAEFDAAALTASGIRIEVVALADKFIAVAVLLGLAFAYHQAGALVPRHKWILSRLTDLLLALTQVFALAEICVPLSYLASTADRPLIDAQLAAFDATLGFDWDAMAGWVHGHRWAEIGLYLAYFSISIQVIVLLVASSIVRSGERASELVWAGMAAILLTAFISVWTPALAHHGAIGVAHIEVLEAIRNGQWTAYPVSKPEGIVQFPSFHTTLALMFLYLARREKWLFVAAVPLNVAMLLSIPPIGGHYLADMLGGSAVFAASVIAVRALTKTKGVKLCPTRLRALSSGP